MEIKLEDYIHFYIGCEIIDVTKAQGTLSGTHGEYGPEVAYGTSEEPEYPGIENIKLILRKLSDMTEEEKLKLYGMGFTHNSKGLQIAHPKKWPTFKPVQFQYLLSIGIDLFGLIPAGLAIDKTSSHLIGTKNMTLFERLNKFAGKYEFNFQMWGEGKYSIYVSKDGVDLWSCGGEETAEDAIKKTLNYLKSIKATITNGSKPQKYAPDHRN